MEKVKDMVSGKKVSSRFNISDKLSFTLLVSIVSIDTDKVVSIDCSEFYFTSLHLTL